MCERIARSCWGTWRVGGQRCWVSCNGEGSGVMWITQRITHTLRNTFRVPSVWFVCRCCSGKHRKELLGHFAAGEALLHFTEWDLGWPYCTYLTIFWGKDFLSSFMTFNNLFSQEMSAEGQGSCCFPFVESRAVALLTHTHSARVCATGSHFCWSTVLISFQALCLMHFLNFVSMPCFSWGFFRLYWIHEAERQCWRLLWNPWRKHPLISMAPGLKL